MPDSQWLNHRARKKNYLWLIIIIAAIGIGAGIFIRNNSEIFVAPDAQKKEPVSSEPPKVAPTPAPRSAIPVIAPERVPQTPRPPAKASPEKSEAGSRQVAAAPNAAGAVSLNGITCKLMDKTRPSMRLSLSLVFPKNHELEQEILMKRDDLKIMVQKTLASKSVDEIKRDSLKKDIKSALNPLLENGAITDIEFKEFRIDKVE